MHEQNTKSSEQDDYAAFFASGGTVKKLPPCCLALTGAVSRELVGDGSQMKEPTYRIRMSAQADATKAERTKAGRVDNPDGGKGRRGNPAIAQALAIMQARRANKTACRLNRILRTIAGDWTTERIALAAYNEECQTKTLRAFLRDHGYGDKLPTQAKGKRPPPDPNRNMAVRLDYEAGMSQEAMQAKHNITGKSILRAVRAAGGTVRPMGKAPKSPRKGVLAPPSDIDRKAAELYLSGQPAEAVAKATGISFSTVFAALARCGVKSRSSAEARALADAKNGSAARMARVIELHQSGMTDRQIDDALGYKSQCSPRKIVKAWRAEQAARGDA